MHIPQLCRNKWPTLPIGVVHFKLKPGLIRAFDGLRVNVCPLNTNHLFFTLWPSVLTARPVWWGWGNLSITAPCPAWERPAEGVLTIVKLGEMSPDKKCLDGDPVSHLDLLWGLSSWGGGPGGQHHLALRWPSCLGSVMCTWRGSWLEDGSLHLSLCGKHCQNYRSCFIGWGSWGLNELSRATQRARGRAGSTPQTFPVLRGSSRPHCILEADIQQPCGLCRCLNGR